MEVVPSWDVVQAVGATVPLTGLLPSRLLSAKLTALPAPTPDAVCTAMVKVTALPGCTGAVGAAMVAPVAGPGC